MLRKGTYVGKYDNSSDKLCLPKMSQTVCVHVLYQYSQESKLKTDTVTDTSCHFHEL